MEQSADDPPHLEHRWGCRLRCKARVRFSTGSGITGAGRIRDISSSGAFIETSVRLPLETRLSLVVLGNESATDVVERSATVVRVAEEGIGIEWCQTSSCSICSAIGCSVRCEAPGAPE